MRTLIKIMPEVLLKLITTNGVEFTRRQLMES